VDGPFVEAKKNLSLRFRGSENQRLIDVKASLEAGETILWDDKQKGMRENNDIHSC
jgi:anaerobic ribonucleoside-triphosphate reductase activating protein